MLFLVTLRNLAASNVKLVLLINMSLPEAALRKLTKDKVIALTLEYKQNLITLYPILTKN